jgi:hypothetical protein
MFKRNTLVILALVLTASLCAAADAVEVELTDGRTLTGVLRTVTDGMYLLQADDALYELGGREIRTVDGRPGAPALDDEDEKLVYKSSFYNVLPDGDVEYWSAMGVENSDKKLLTWMKWGAAAHELDAYETMVALDVYGNELTHRVEPRKGTESYDVIVDFAVPVMPGEFTEITFRTLQRDLAQVVNGVWTFTHRGHYAEDRLQDLKLRLPAGAEVLTVSPLVRVIEHDDASLVFWRRYYPKNTGFPLTVTYKLD